ncbi:UNVERIFIED_CONTAM: hypothetical protein FKN15_068145 [Acipenser sinensis]
MHASYWSPAGAPSMECDGAAIFFGYQGAMRPPAGTPCIPVGISVRSPPQLAQKVCPGDICASSSVALSASGTCRGLNQGRDGGVYREEPARPSFSTSSREASSASCFSTLGPEAGRSQEERTSSMKQPIGSSGIESSVIPTQWAGISHT